MKTNGIDLTGALNVDDFQNLEEPNNLNINVFELHEDKKLIQIYISKNMKKTEDNHDDIHEDNKLDNFENQDISRGKIEIEHEKHIQDCGKNNWFRFISKSLITI